MSAPDWLTKAALRSAESEGMLASIFRAYCELQNVSRDMLARELGCSGDVLNWMSLCYRPENDRFAEQIGRVAERFHVDPKRLAAIVRRVDVVGIMKQESAKEARSGAHLMAARDRKSRKKGTKRKGRRS